MQYRRIGRSELKVSSIGLGCMGMSEFYGPIDSAESITVIHRALDLGVTMLDTASSYGVGHNESLVGKAIAGRREELVLASKCGIVREGEDGGKRRIDNSPAYVRSAVDSSLKRLGVDHIDLYYIHRRDPQVPIEEPIGALAELVQAGKIRAIGLSEVGAETLRRAHAVHPVAALQSEYSLASRDIEEQILPVASELGVSVVAYSPLGRSLLTGRVREADVFGEDDLRCYNPRFVGKNLAANVRLASRLAEVAVDVGCTPAQLALAWLLAQDPGLIVIPGTKKATYLEENAGAAEIELDDAQLAAIEEAFPRGAFFGLRNHPSVMPTLEL
ncbi:aldo/keto reductase [Kitasatospora sp. NPDC096077]|uniref:aldo/keto reductase n=1 Tax=Kitasatospora sp. NPDC096077 TaxID=3155544 RepID=UPI003330651A